MCAFSRGKITITSSGRNMGGEAKYHLTFSLVNVQIHTPYLNTHTVYPWYKDITGRQSGKEI